MKLRLQPHLSAAELEEEFDKLKKAFFMTEWGKGLAEAMERYGIAKQLVHAEMLHLQKIHESEAINAAYHPTHLSLQELYAVYSCIVKDNGDQSEMKSFFDQKKASLIYRALLALSPERRLFEIGSIVQAFEDVLLDEIILMLEFIPEAKGREDHPAYIGFLDTIRNVKRGFQEPHNIKFLIQVADNMYRALRDRTSPPERDFFHVRGVAAMG